MACRRGTVGVKCAGYVDGSSGWRAGSSHSLSDVISQMLFLAAVVHFSYVSGGTERAIDQLQSMLAGRQPETGQTAAQNLRICIFVPFLFKIGNVHSGLFAETLVTSQNSSLRPFLTLTD